MPIKANYSESMIAMLVEHYLTLLSWPFHHFSVVTFTGRKERILGADAKIYPYIRAFKPLYVQFKRPVGYNAIDQAFFKN